MHGLRRHHRVPVTSLLSALRHGRVSVTSLLSTLRHGRVSVTSLLSTLCHYHVSVTSLLSTSCHNHVPVTSLLSTLHHGRYMWRRYCVSTKSRMLAELEIALVMTIFSKPRSCAFKKNPTGSRTGQVKNKESYNSLVKNHLSASVGRHHPMIRVLCWYISFCVFF